MWSVKRIFERDESLRKKYFMILEKCMSHKNILMLVFEIKSVNSELRCCKWGGINQTRYCKNKDNDPYTLTDYSREKSIKIVWLVALTKANDLGLDDKTWTRQNLRTTCIWSINVTYKFVPYVTNRSHCKWAN